MDSSSSITGTRAADSQCDYLHNNNSATCSAACVANHRLIHPESSSLEFILKYCTMCNFCSVGSYKATSRSGRHVKTKNDVHKELCRKLSVDTPSTDANTKEAINNAVQHICWLYTRAAPGMIWWQWCRYSACAQVKNRAFQLCQLAQTNANITSCQKGPMKSKSGCIRRSQAYSDKHYICLLSARFGKVV